MDHDVVVKPAKGDEVFRISRPTFRPGDHVVSLESISTRTPLSGASAIAMENESSQAVWDDPAPSPNRQRSAIHGTDQFEAPCARHLVENLGANRGAPRDLDALVIDEDGDERRRDPCRA
jgi:hypothetical protein